MAFGLKRQDVKKWKASIDSGEIAFITHYWLDDRFPGCTTVTKVGCKDINALVAWGKKYGLQPSWIHRDEKYPHFDLFGERQKEILLKEGQWEQINRFKL
ncbi:hypothetical protein [Ornithinibacillus bavariensis]|uniref:YneQ n=1 Tax=Ornithinibacillus bavariensis TaxID=545502 RepID=A0A920C6M5_9BACI|nr:hypothetical protein [Ornithinibacillus bavariensis]GIO26259.1 hypothetical protein J43TS3_08700 [Ornithinibacillus bavariensis]